MGARHLSLEARRKISVANRGRRRTEETRKKLSLAFKGRPSPMKGRHHTEEARRRMSDAQKRFLAEYLKYHVHWKKGKHPRTEFKKGNTIWVGRHHREESKRKISERLKGKTLPLWVRERMSQGHLGIVPWDKGLTKETSESLARSGEKSRKRWTAERRHELSERNKRWVKEWWRQHPEAKERLVSIARPTRIELLARDSLARRGISFHVNKSVEAICIPDVVVPDRKIAIFCNGCFWHGCPVHCPVIPAWLRLKIKDKEIYARLEAIGWRVLVAWEHDFKLNEDVVGEKLDEMLSTVGGEEI